MAVARIALPRIQFLLSLEIDLRVSADCVVTIRQHVQPSRVGVLPTIVAAYEVTQIPIEQSGVKPAKNLVIDFLKRPSGSL